MKVIDLLVKIANKEIKEHTFFRRVGITQYVHSKKVDKYEYIDNDRFMIWFENEDVEPINYNVILNIELNDEIEIIEEVEKFKEIEPIKNNQNRNDKINELIKAVNYLLKKEKQNESNNNI